MTSLGLRLTGGPFVPPDFGASVVLDAAAPPPLLPVLFAPEPLLPVLFALLPPSSSR